MEKYKLVLTGVLVLAALISFLELAGQNSNCKVLMPEISGSYVGDCRKGLAHGKGSATGADRYEGQFNKGLPHGNGAYHWNNGPVYTGEWSKGIMDGKGEIVYITARGDSTVSGYWRNGAYTGRENIPPYTIIRKDNLLSCNIRKIGEGKNVILKFMRKGQRNPSLGGLTIIFSSGTQFKAGMYEGIQNVYFPLDIKITYVTNNPISLSQFDVVLECTINEPGTWEVILNN
jgi:hypothetical protein